MTDTPQEPHYPGRASIEGYGKGGFRFAGMSHRGSLLFLPRGIWAWPPASATDVNEAALRRVFDQRDEIDLLLIGTGLDPVPLPEPLRWRLRELGIRFDVMPTAAAASTYNVLLAEGRRVAAALIATE
jgi:uncharacterized protein